MSILMLWVAFSILCMVASPTSEYRNKTGRRHSWKNKFHRLESKVNRAIEKIDRIEAQNPTVTTNAPQDATHRENKMEEQIRKLQLSIDILTSTLNGFQTANDAKQQVLDTSHKPKQTQQTMKQGFEDNMQHDGIPETQVKPFVKVPIPTTYENQTQATTDQKEVKKIISVTEKPTNYNSLIEKLEEMEKNFEQSHFQLNRKLLRIQQKLLEQETANLPPLPSLETQPSTSHLATEVQVKELQEHLEKVQQIVQLEMKAVQHLLNLELGVALRAMQTDVQRCARASHNMRHVGKILTRSFDNSWEDMEQGDDPLPQLISSRRAQTVNREAQLDHLGAVSAVELMKFKPRSCAQVFRRGFTKSGVYTIWITNPSHSTPLQMYAYCDMETDGGGWTVIQRRGNFGGTFENFTRSWEDYKRGFGKVTQEFWFGNDAIHSLTQQDQVKLRVELDDWNGQRTYAEYELFQVASEKEAYKLTVGNYSGNMPDSLLYHDNGVFSTVDKNSGNYSTEWCVFLQGQGGGWWYKNCYMAKLNAPYKMQAEVGRAEGIQWRMWKGYQYSFKGAEMKLRPVSYQQP